MYTADQYQRAKSQLANADKTSPKYAEVKAKVSEFERYNPEHNAPVEGAHALSGEKLEGPPQAAPVEPKLSHESAPIEQQGALEAQGIQEAPAAAPDVADETKDEYLPNASKLKSFATPPEYASKRPLAGLANIAAATVKDPLDGPLANSYYEPSEQQFLAEQAPLLKAKGIEPGSEAFRDQFAEYKDRKWAQAYQKAEAEDRPLTRMEYIGDHAKGWDKLKNVLADSFDSASAFTKGLAAGRTLQGSKVLSAASDALTGQDETGDDAAQAERNPISSFAGEFKGAVKGPLAQLTKAATPFGQSASLGARIGGAAIGGAAAGVADNASRSIATGVADLAHGRGLGAAEDQFTSHLAGSALLGGGLGALGQGVAEGANAWQKAVLRDMPELGQLRRGGGDTDVLRGLRPGKAVAENLEAAREPLPGEDKVPLGANPTEVAVGKVRGPLAQAHTDTNAATFERLGAEKQAAIEADPNLQRPVVARNAAQAAVDWVRSKVQPGGGYIPGMKLSVAQTTPGSDVAEAQKLALQLYKPRVVTATEANAVARSSGGYVTDIDDAKRMGFDVAGLDDTGVPAGAPPVDEGAVSVPKLLPKYPKDVAVGDVAKDVTPQEAEAIRRYTWGKRQPGDADLVNSYLERAPVSNLPHVYRGIAMKPDQAADMLATGTFSTGDAPASASFDPTVARSFAARNRNPGDVGITFKLEGSEARNITPLAHDQVGIEKELLVPGGKNFEIVSKHPDPAHEGDWIVVARAAPPEAPAGTSTADVFGRPADKVSSSPIDRLKPREGRAFKTPTGPVGSEWFDQEKAAETVALHSHDYEVADPFAAMRSKAPGNASADTPTMPGGAETGGTPSIRPTSAPPELRATPTPQAAQAEAAGVPGDHFKVVLEPREYDADTFERILGDIDRKAGYAKATGAPDPQWEKLAQAIREDRKQFGPGWTDLIGKHHQELNQLEQRSYHSGMGQDKAYPEMGGNAQQRLQGKLKSFPSDVDSNKALRELADKAPAGVRADLEALGATNAYQKLKGQSGLKIGESIGSGGIVGRLAGVGGFLKPRTDALARGLAAGPTGEPTLTPRLADYVRKNAPGSKWLPGVPAMGGGALGLKAAVAYDTLTPTEQAFLEKLLSAAKPNDKAGATP
jgi:hypothetical protein